MGRFITAIGVVMSLGSMFGSIPKARDSAFATFRSSSGEFLFASNHSRPTIVGFLDVLGRKSIGFVMLSSVLSIP